LVFDKLRISSGAPDAYTVPQIILAYVFSRLTLCAVREANTQLLILPALVFVQFWSGVGFMDKNSALFVLVANVLGGFAFGAAPELNA
jgi:hypothetical protein